MLNLFETTTTNWPAASWLVLGATLAVLAVAVWRETRSARAGVAFSALAMTILGLGVYHLGAGPDTQNLAPAPGATSNQSAP